MKKANNIHIHNLLGTYPEGKLLRMYALPAVLNMLVIALYNIVDRIFIGHGAGAMAICGLALTLPCITLASTPGTLTGVGAAARTTLALIGNDYAKAEKILGNALLLALAVSAGLSFLALKWLEPLLFNFGGSEQTVPYAVSYLRIMIPACIIGNINFTLVNSVRIAGHRRKLMTIMIAGPVLNILLDSLFIFVFRMGIEGAAWASAVSMLCTLLLIAIHFTGKKIKIRMHRLNFKPDMHTTALIIAAGMAAFIMHITSGMVNIIINRQLSSADGDFAVGAFGIIGSLMFVISGIHQGICQGMQPIVNFNYGSGNRDRVVQILKKGIKTATAVAVAGYVVFEVFAPELMSAFTSDANLISIGTSGLRYTAILLPLTGFQTISASFFQSVSQPAKAIAINISRQFLFLIPALIFMSARWGLAGIWLATPAADAMVALPTAAILFYSLKYGSCSDGKL